MRTFATDGTNDFLISGRSMALVSDIEAVLLVCRHCAQAILGEMVFAAEQGMPYFETVWVGAPSTAPFEAAFRDRVARIDGVRQINSLEVYQEANVMRYSAEIETIYGQGVVNG